MYFLSAQLVQFQFLTTTLKSCSQQFTSQNFPWFIHPVGTKETSDKRRTVTFRFMAWKKIGVFQYGLQYPKLHLDKQRIQK